MVAVFACPFCGGVLPLMRGTVEGSEARFRRIWAKVRKRGAE